MSRRLDSLSKTANTRLRYRTQPAWIPPMLATLADRAFDHPDWLFEVKWDGYRVEAVIRDGTAGLWTRNETDAGAYFPSPELVAIRSTAQPQSHAAVRPGFHASPRARSRRTPRR